MIMGKGNLRNVAAFDSAIGLWQGAPALDSPALDFGVLLMHGPVVSKLWNFTFGQRGRADIKET